MNFRKTILIGFLLSLTAPALAAPYDDLAYALRQQKIINDLRNHCQIDPTVSDAKIKSTFLHDKQTESQILAVAAALRNNNNDAYGEAIDDIECPDIK
ncbi:YicS family protein [Erwinia billingiae]|uniref:YicS family protein n=1 Tax=Erwinia billingiae TaxID=182337 RepID=UPI00069F721C|nr:YicS family protein [Erwinia billingiae]